MSDSTIVDVQSALIDGCGKFLATWVDSFSLLAAQLVACGVTDYRLCLTYPEAWQALSPCPNGTDGGMLEDTLFAAPVPIACNDPIPTYHRYGYRLMQVPDSIVFLFSQQPLNLEQHQAIAQQLNLLDSYLAQHRVMLQQQQEIQLLRRVLQQTGHQLRNSVGMVGLFAENLRRSLEDDPRQAQVLPICEVTEQMSERLNWLMSRDRQKTLQVLPTNLHDLLQQTLLEMQPLLAQKQVRVESSTTALVAVVDDNQIKQVLENLLSNALHFSPVEGVITCLWTAFQEELVVEISDQGPGLSAEDLQQIFTPYYSRRAGGKGLGLAIARSIVQQHGGRLWAKNLPQGGAQFCFTLPLHGRLS